MSQSGRHPPSSKALQKAMEQGDVPISGLLSGAAAILLLCLLAEWAAGGVVREFEQSLRRAAESAALPSPLESLAAPVDWSHPFLSAAAQIGLLLLAFALLAMLVGGLQTRGWFSLKPLSPRAERMAPTVRFLSAETARSLLVGGTSILVALGVAMTIWLSNSQGIAALSVAAPKSALHSIAIAIRSVLFWSAAILVVLGFVDLTVARLLHRNRHRMSDRDVERERREAEGHAAQKHERSRQAREALQEQVQPTVWIWGPRGAIGILTTSGSPKVILRQRRVPDDVDAAEAPALVIQLWGRVGRPVPRALYGALARATRRAQTHDG